MDPRRATFVTNFLPKARRPEDRASRAARELLARADAAEPTGLRAARFGQMG